MSQRQYVKNFNWLLTWKDNHLRIVINEIFPQVLLVIILLILGGNIFKENKLNRINFLLLNITLISSLIWFLKFPIYRYGQAYIISFINILF